MTRRVLWTAALASPTGLEEVRSRGNALADLVDFRAHSDLALVLVWEVRGRRVDELCRVWTQVVDWITPPPPAPWTGDEEGQVVLQLNFRQAQGEVRRQVPAVPG